LADEIEIDEENLGKLYQDGTKEKVSIDKFFFINVFIDEFFYL
jgi:hypothetical protein